jgi:dTDP-4-amino-4,6-dideoxygalactose transaminase
VRRIPLVDLAAQHAEVAGEISAGFERVIAATAFVGGAEVGAFEDELARFCEARHCVGVANGTDAIEIALRASGIRPGDEVIVPANTFIATVGAVHRAGALPVLVDCDPELLLIDPKLVERAISARTRAVVAVDLYGQMAPIEQLVELVAGRGITVIEDAAQSQGATRFGQPVGALAGAAATSFYPGKNLGAYGDAGAIITGDAALAAEARAIANHGGTRRYEHRLPGFNSRLDALQAVVLRAKLARLADWNAARRLAAARYDQALAGLAGVSRVAVAPGNVPVWHLYVIRVPQRDRVLAALNEAGVGAGVHYAAPVHMTGAFGWLGDGPGTHPNAEAASREILSLPLHPHLTERDQQHVVDVLAAVLR